VSNVFGLKGGNKSSMSEMRIVSNPRPWLCLVEGYLASLHDLVSFKIEHTICSRMRCITKENTIDRPNLEFVQLLPFLKDKTLATKDMEVTHLGCATVHQLVTCFLLVDSEVDPV
jgi:hypothetical protein